MPLTDDDKKFLAENTNKPIEKIETKTTTQWQPKYADNAKTLDELRTELEKAKLLKELKKLEEPETPQTNMDFIKTMLEMQNNHFAAMEKLRDEQHKIQLELIKAQSSEVDSAGDDIIKMLLPALPEILKARNAQVQQTTTKKEAQNVTEIRKRKPTKKQLEEYQKKIKSGDVSMQQFIKDVKENYPEYSKIPEEMIASKYNEIKNAK